MNESNNKSKGEKTHSVSSGKWQRISHPIQNKHITLLVQHNSRPIIVLASVTAMKYLREHRKATERIVIMREKQIKIKITNSKIDGRK